MSKFRTRQEGRIFPESKMEIYRKLVLDIQIDKSNEMSERDFIKKYQGDNGNDNIKNSKECIKNSMRKYILWSRPFKKWIHP